MADLQECHLFECQSCYEKAFVFDPPRKGDRLVCPSCGAKDKVQDIIGDWRDSKKSVTLELTKPMDVI